MKLNLNFKIPPWGEHLKPWEHLIQEIEDIRHEVKVDSSKYKPFYELFKKFPPADEIKEILESNDQALYPFSYLIHSNDKFYSLYFTDELIAFIIQLYNVSNKSLRYMQLGYVNRLDHQSLSTENTIQLFNLFRDNLMVDYDLAEDAGLFTSVPSEKLVCVALEQNCHPKSILDDCRIEVDSNSNFYKLFHTKYLLARLKKTSFESETELDIMDALCDSQFYEWNYRDELVGHEIIRILLSSKQKLNQKWIEFIIQIAKDPRVSKSTKNYRKWWKVLGEGYVNKFVSLLSEEDILLFLQALKTFAKENQKQDMDRMFQSRQIFLGGLSNQNLISKTRLFLPSSVIKYLEENRPNLDLSYVCELKNAGSICVIYLVVQSGKYHIIEGSHSFRIQIYDQGFRHDYDLLSQDTNQIDIKKLRSVFVPKFFKKIFNNRQYLIETHDQTGRWKEKAVRYLSRELKLDSESLFTEEELNFFRHYQNW